MAIKVSVPQAEHRQAAARQEACSSWGDRLNFLPHVPSPNLPSPGGWRCTGSSALAPKSNKVNNIQKKKKRRPMSQSLRGFKTFTPVRRRGCGSPRSMRKAVRAGAESHSFPLLICASASPHPQHSVLTQRYIMSDPAALTQRPVDRGLQKGPSVDWRKGGARMGGRSAGWGEPPQNHLSLKI